MTDKKISELTSITGADVSDANDVLPIVDTSVATTKKITRAELFKGVSSVDINGGTIDGTVIGATTPAAISGTTGTFSGNVGIGIVPSDWASFKGIQAQQGSLVSNQFGAGNLQTLVGSNIFFDGAYKYIVSDFASYYNQSGGDHTWYTAPSGTAGAAATLTERMRITNSGNVTINGSLSKGSGSFKIDHPLKPETHHLVHSFIEGPQADNIYRGKVALVDGTATVNLDDAARMTEGTFVALNGNVQCFTTNEDGWTAVRGKVDGNILTIEAQEVACTDTVSWLVVGERHDQHILDTDWTDEQGRVITEPAKETAQ